MKDILQLILSLAGTFTISALLPRLGIPSNTSTWWMTYFLVGTGWFMLVSIYVRSLFKS